MDDEIAEILGFAPDPPTPPKSARRERSEQMLEQLVAKKREHKASDDIDLTVSGTMHGVSVAWLAQVFHMDPTTVRKRLADCTPMDKTRKNHLYDLKMAAPYLVKPKVDVEAYMKSIKVSELPTHLQEAYWNAMRKRQQWEEAAGHLWRTEAVQEVLADTFKVIKSSFQLFPDHVERAKGLTPQQREMIQQMCDALQNEVHQRLIEMPAKKATLPTSAEAQMEGMVDGPAEDDDGYSHLV